MPRILFLERTYDIPKNVSFFSSRRKLSEPCRCRSQTSLSNHKTEGLPLFSV